MDDLLKEAIADAKAVRQTAFENAKIALEEAFTPKIQSMLSKKIQNETEGEETEEDEEAEEMADAEEQEAEGGEEDEKEVDVAVGDDSEETDVPVEDEEEVPAEEADEVEAEEDEEYPAEEGEDSLDLEAIIRELEGEEAEEAEEPAEEGDDEAEVDETIELNGKTYRVVSEEEETEEDEETVEEQSDSSKIGTGDNKVDVADSGDEEDPGKGEKSQKMESFNVDSKIFEEEETEEDEDAVEEDIDLEEVLKSLSEEEETEEDDEVQEENVKLKAELGEHRKVVKYLKSKLNEINLLNAKLLFTNKLFKAYNLDNDEKMKVVETFDRANNLREIKLVFSTLAESFGFNTEFKKNTSVKNISEGASKAGGTTKPPKKVISEGNALSNRFKKLAGII